MPTDGATDQEMRGGAPRHTQTTFRTDDGLRLFSQSWLPAGEARAVLALVHGIGEHSGRYGNLVNAISQSGFAIAALDHRGHGSSPGQRGHINSWKEYREDVRAFLDHVRGNVPDRPVFLYGHSLGSLIVLDYVLAYPRGLAGLIVSGTALQPVGVARGYLVALAKVLSRLLPAFSVSLGIDASTLSRDAAVVQAYRDDPLVHSRVTMRWGTESLAAIERVRSRAAEISLPLLVVHGEADRINSVEGSRELYWAVSSTDRKLCIYPGGSHEPHNDLDHLIVSRDIEYWLSSR